MTESDFESAWRDFISKHPDIPDLLQLDVLTLSTVKHACKNFYLRGVHDTLQKQQTKLVSGERKPQ